MIATADNNTVTTTVAVSQGLSSIRLAIASYTVAALSITVYPRIVRMGKSGTDPMLLRA
ncbi:MAG: hypothetical protein IID09_04245 [Candidatus Hydrogenedentes bacterium]|nr:hypothetical protein [Candidatus Hydrogenedentota bacterium]